MRRILFLLFAVHCSLGTVWSQTKTAEVLFETTAGNIRIALYDETPQHRDNYTIMAMGITPYINASIIMQLLCVAIPKLEELQKEGEEGRKKIAQITRYVTVGLGFVQAIALTIGLNQRQFGLDSELHFNSQAAVFGEAAKEMSYLLHLQGADHPNNLFVGVGDLYVTVYGGRTRLAGILLGRGLDIDETQKELAGVTLESLVVARRVARAMRIRASQGLADLTKLPLLMHVDEILSQKKPVKIPWESFTFVQA